MIIRDLDGDNNIWCNWVQQYCWVVIMVGVFHRENVWLQYTKSILDIAYMIAMDWRPQITWI